MDRRSTACGLDVPSISNTALWKTMTVMAGRPPQSRSHSSCKNARGIMGSGAAAAVRRGSAATTVAAAAVAAAASSNAPHRVLRHGRALSAVALLGIAGCSPRGSDRENVRGTVQAEGEDWVRVSVRSVCVGGWVEGGGVPSALVGGQLHPRPPPGSAPESTAGSSGCTVRE